MLTQVLVANQISQPCKCRKSSKTSTDTDVSKTPTINIPMPIQLKYLSIGQHITATELHKISQDKLKNTITKAATELNKLQ